MVKEAFASEETVVLAKKKACDILGVPEEMVEFEILQMPERKKLGLFGGKLAQVRAYVKVSQEEKAKEFLKEVLYYMGLENLNVNVGERKDGECAINITGDDIKFIVGRHGETLDALQYLSSVVANNNNEDNEFCKIRVNAGDYRERRKCALEALGRRMAYRAEETGMKIELEPMRAYERKIIHSVVCTMDGVYSWSEGFDGDRHVVIAPGNNGRYEVRRMYDKEFSDRVTNKSTFSDDYNEEE